MASKALLVVVLLVLTLKSLISATSLDPRLAILVPLRVTWSHPEQYLEDSP